MGDKPGAGEAGQYPDNATDNREGDGLHQELADNLRATCSKGTTDTDFTRAFRDGCQHDVHDADTPHQQ